MRTQSLVRLVAALAVASVASVAYGQGKPRVVEMTGNDQMKFSVTTINAKPGEMLTVRLKAVGTMPKIAMAHNFVLLALKTDPAAFANAAVMASATGYVPAAQKAKVIAHTGLAGNGETVEVTFKVPAAGTYDYICSFPGHFLAGMRGKLVVK
jgi:azurin